LKKDSHYCWFGHDFQTILLFWSTT
jgi:hypothetical protein